MHATLTSNAIQSIANREEPTGFAPIVQVLNIKPVSKEPVTGTDKPERYRCIFSDGGHYIQGMLSTQMVALVHSGVIQKNSIVRLIKYALSPVHTKTILIALDMQVLQATAERVGDPKQCDIKALDAPVTHVTSPGSNVGASSMQYQATTRNDSNPYAPTVRPATHDPLASYNQLLPQSSFGGAPDLSSERITTIASLNPYQNRWTIRARVTSKSDIKHWNNARGEGKLFSVTFLDESGEIRATGFNQQVDQFYELLEEGKVYYVSKARVTLAKAAFAGNIKNDYELTFDSGTVVALCHDQSGRVPTMKYDFVGIGDLMKHDKDATIDVIGVCHEVHPIAEIISKTTQQPLQKRDIVLVDQSRCAVRVTLWGKQAEAFMDSYGETHPVVAFRGVRVGDYNGRSLSVLGSSHVARDPDIPVAHTLRGWYDTQGHSTSFTPYTSASIPGQSGQGAGGNENTFLVDTSHLGANPERPDYFTTEATIMYFKTDNAFYPACPGENCSKKVVEETHGWRCEKCQQNYPHPDYRYILSVNVSDCTGHAWVSCFNEVASAILGRSAQEMHMFKDAGVADYEQTFKDACFKSYTFKCRAKQENYQDSSKVRITVLSATEVNPVVQAKRLAEQIKQYNL